MRIIIERQLFKSAPAKSLPHPEFSRVPLITSSVNHQPVSSVTLHEYLPVKRAHFCGSFCVGQVILITLDMMRGPSVLIVLLYNSARWAIIFVLVAGKNPVAVVLR